MIPGGTPSRGKETENFLPRPRPAIILNDFMKIQLNFLEVRLGISIEAFCARRSRVYRASKTTQKVFFSLLLLAPSVLTTARRESAHLPAPFDPTPSHLPQKILYL
jgi:hypothetical protein